MKNWIDVHFEEHMGLLKELAAIPAPSHHEEKRAEYLLEKLHEAGYPEAYCDEAKNVVLPLGFDKGEKAVCFLAHIDVVFPDLTPLPVHEENGRLYAPGVGDNTADAAAMLTILRYVKEKGLKPVSPVLFVFNSCEEGLGNLAGIRQIMRDHEGRIKQVVSFDCYFSEGIMVKAVGSERWKVSASTRGGHSFNAFGSPNAIHRMAQLINRLYEQDIPEREGSRTTYNAGMVSGGTSINTIAQNAELYYEYRSDDRECLAVMRGQFKKLLDEADCADAHFEAELIGERPCGGEVDEKEYAALIEKSRRVITGVLGAEPKLSAGSTDANIPLSLGIPAVTFGLVEGEGAHTRGEWLDIGSLKKGLEIGLKTVLEHFENVCE